MSSTEKDSLCSAQYLFLIVILHETGGKIMRFEIVGKNVTVTQAMREQIEKKLSALEKYLLIDPNTMVRVVARVYPNSQKVEITVPTKVGILRTEVVNDDFYAAVDLAIDKLEDQIRRQKTRLSRRHREHLADAFILAAFKICLQGGLCRRLGSLG